MGNICTTPGAADVAAPARTRSSTSSGAASEVPLKPVSALDSLLAAKVKAYIALHHVQASKSLNQIVLKFPSILKAFEEIRGIFKQLDTNGNGTIERDEFTAACGKMAAGVSADVIEKIYTEADMDQNGHVNYKEFIIMMAVLFLMTDEAAGEAVQLGQLPGEAEDGQSATLVHTAIQKVLEAFLFFDNDADGYILKDEVHKVISEGDGGKKMLSAERFEEMDWDNSGRVTFKEFLFAVEGWVGLEEEPQEEE
mmetsp:Transcript_32384/g.79927  ORF Transcript_32384/g.79927 Transcript_32384/m.79927 type:complete len:253 (-) Transcript_32384:329-1087(-)|eukprot:CAMPEP_0197593674 /NCGR_PEP_ID=MMETSP1326-20131121/18732_1 /TAXON_ID=1155430 /ORGANISM="Genus nov. species nov., Strain RCC2288" /LENGTH=252 /DNA_ID=CAMNT_0043159699 /DNA_START=106 /DNA_END=864 /DNA_ORIENTATION=+